MKRLLVFTEVYNRGGGNRYMIDLVNGIAENYGEVLVVTNSGGLYSKDTQRLTRPVTSSSAMFITRSLLGNYIRGWPKLIRSAIALPLLLLEPLFLLCNVVLFCLLLRRIKPSHVLSCNGGYPAAAACLAMVVASQLLRLPVVLSVVSMPMARRPFLQIYERFVDWLIWRAVAVVIVNAVAIADRLCAIRSMPSSKFAVVYNGLEDEPVRVLSLNRDRPLVIGCIARMDVSKGALVLFEAFVVLAKIRPELRLVLAGYGDASFELARRTQSLGLQGRVELMGHYDGDVDVLISTFDLYVFPSLWEGFPYSIIEAMRAGAAIIATRVGGIPEAIMDGQEGILVDPGSRDAIASAIQRLIDDPLLRHSLGRNAQLKFRTSHSLDQMHHRAREVFAAYQF